ncbi:hypothetical protein WG66_007804 [Moniliophthora roreri]|nr:hypothetical protein WG66_007804 [Moniliophthora roreri]
MSAQENQNSVNQLVELILQLKKTTPAAARQILNSQPQIAYAVMELLVNMNAINVEVFQKTLTAFAQSQAAPGPSQPPAPTPQPAIPPHMQPPTQPYYNRTSTPPTSTPTPPVAAQPPNPYSNGYQNSQSYGYNVPSAYNQGGYGQGYGGPGGYPGYPPPPQASYGAPTPAPAPAPAPTPTPQQPHHQQSVLSQVNSAILAAIPEEQKAMVVHVLSMTPEMINQLSPQDRANIMQLRATLGLQ